MGHGGSFGVAVKAAIVKAGRLLVLYKTKEEARYDPDPSVRVDLPGGRIRFGESPVAALHREVAEETGLVIEMIAPIETWHYVKMSTRHPARRGEFAAAYRAAGSGGEAGG